MGNAEQIPDEKRDTLGQMLYLLNAADDGLSELQPDQLKELMTNLESKVDSYKYVLEKFDLEIERIKKRVVEYQSIKKTLENNRRALLDQMSYQMEEQGFDKLPGNEFQVTLVKKKDVELKELGTPGPEQYRKFPAFVKRNYEWSKSSLKQGIKSDPEALKEFGEMKETKYVRFSIKKGI